MISRNSRRYSRTAAVWKKRGKMFDFFVFFFAHFCRRRNQLFFSLYTTRQHADKNQFVRRWTFDLGIDAPHGQTAWCQARPTSADGGLEHIRWINGQGGDSSSAASYALLPNLKTSLFLLPFKTDRALLSFVFCTPAANCLFYHTYTWSTPATYHRPIC